ncbi:hypothetical protein SISSUDRAFT_174346 [Sistotremastrum suecicum HHB10207 ss-3]|uniref:SAC3/GANP/THP3 conserved domain-containing protein n=1 Tax=Sistotremastrum suecicum HHB10207 ss-3 TaxID=1314776 RepID=A0A166AIU0_9AGAM|nr:hypothetical protein SISSUDRAFT_174346 [Sistotremastrum suecicum HHB10207 ss-3]
MSTATSSRGGSSKPPQSRNKTWTKPVTISSAPPFAPAPSATIPDGGENVDEDPNLPGNHWRQLQRAREAERKWAIEKKLMPDPDARYKIEDAITMKGTCEDMCAEYERHEREAKALIDPWEYVGGPSSKARPKRIDHALAVRCYQRGVGDQALPSDLRTPAACLRTVDYLFNLSVRQDLRLQRIEDDVAKQITERCARFHIMSLHELRELPKDRFDPSIEATQIGQTALQSLKELPGTFSPEFRSYYSIFHIKNEPPEAPPDSMPSLTATFAVAFHEEVKKASPAFNRRSEIKVGTEGVELFNQFASRMLDGGPQLAGNFEDSKSAKWRRATVFLISCLLEFHFGSGCVAGIEERRQGLSNLDIVNSDLGDEPINHQSSPAPLADRSQADASSAPTTSLPTASSPFQTPAPPAAQASGIQGFSTFTSPFASASNTFASPFSKNTTQQPGPSIQSVFGNSVSSSPFASSSKSVFAPQAASSSAFGFKSAFGTGVNGSSLNPAAAAFLPSSSSSGEKLSFGYSDDPVVASPSPVPGGAGSSTSSNVNTATSGSVFASNAPVEPHPVQPSGFSIFGASRREEGNPSPPISQPLLEPQPSQSAPESTPSKSGAFSHPPVSPPKPLSFPTAPSSAFTPLLKESASASVQPDPLNSSSLSSNHLPSFPSSSKGFSGGFTPQPSLFSTSASASSSPTPFPTPSTSLFPPTQVPHSSEPPKAQPPPFPSFTSPSASAPPVVEDDVPPADTVLTPSSASKGKERATDQNYTKYSHALFDLMITSVTASTAAEALAAELHSRHQQRVLKMALSKWVDRAIQKAERWAAKVDRKTGVKRERVMSVNGQSSTNGVYSHGDGPYQNYRRIRRRVGENVDLMDALKEREDRRARHWSAGTFLEVVRGRVEGDSSSNSVEDHHFSPGSSSSKSARGLNDSTAVPPLPMDWEIWMSLNDENEQSALWLRTKFDQSSEASDHGVLRIPLYDTQDTADGSPGLLIFECTPMAEGVSGHERSRIIQNDASRLSSFLSSVPSDRIYSTALIVITWTSDMIKDLPVPLAAAINPFLDNGVLHDRRILGLGGLSAKVDSHDAFIDIMEAIPLDIAGSLSQRFSPSNLIKYLAQPWISTLEAAQGLCLGMDYGRHSMNGYVLSAMLSLLDRVADAIQRVSGVDPIPTPPSLTVRGFDDNASSFAAVLRYMESPYFSADPDAIGLRDSLVEALRTNEGVIAFLHVGSRPRLSPCLQNSQQAPLREE